MSNGEFGVWLKAKVLLLTLFPCFVHAFGSRTYCTGECIGLLDRISGGSRGVLLLEIILFVFVGLYLIVKVHDKWF